MLPLVVSLVLCVAALPGADHAALTEWVGSPAVTVSLILMIGAIFYHAQLGLQVVIEDYVATHWRRTAAIIIVSFLCLLFAVIGIVSVLKIALGA